MNIFVSILLTILLLIFLLPIFSPKGIFLIKNMRKPKEEEYEFWRPRERYVIFSTLIAGIIWIGLVFIFIFGKYGIISILQFYIIVPLLKIIISTFFTSKLNIPFKTKLLNTLFVLIICIFSVYIGATSTLEQYHMKVCIEDVIPGNLVEYAEDNNYISFADTHTKFENDSSGKEMMFFNLKNNGTHYFLIEKEKDKNIVLVYDKYHPENSFDAEYDKLFELDEKQLVKQYADIIDNKYRGVNYSVTCYLVNQDEVLAIYGLASKDKATNEYHVEKYVIFDMLTGKISDLKLNIE